MKRKIAIVAYKCKKCGKLHYPFHDRCLACRGRDFEKVEPQGKTKLLTFTRIYNLPWGFDHRYLTIGVVEFENGVRAMGQIHAAETYNLKVGMLLEPKWDTVRVQYGENVYGSYESLTQHRYETPALSSALALVFARVLPPDVRAARSALESGFLNPPPSARPWVYWFPLDGNISSNGITADREAMHRVGIGGVLYMETEQGTPRGPAKFAGPEWRALFQHASAEAHR